MNQCLDLVLLASLSAAFLQLFIFGPYIFNFLVKFVSPSNSTTRISPGQHPDNAGTSCLIILWTLSILCKGTLRSSVYSPFDILYGRPPPVMVSLETTKTSRETTNNQLTWRCPDTSRPWKSILPYHLRNLRKDTHPLGHLSSSLSARRWGIG